MIVDSGTYSVKYPVAILESLSHEISPDSAFLSMKKLGCASPNTNDTITFVASGTGTKYTLQPEDWQTRIPSSNGKLKCEDWRNQIEKADV